MKTPTIATVAAVVVYSASATSAVDVIDPPQAAPGHRNNRSNIRRGKRRNLRPDLESRGPLLRSKHHKWSKSHKSHKSAKTSSKSSKESRSRVENNYMHAYNDDYLTVSHAPGHSQDDDGYNIADYPTLFLNDDYAYSTNDNYAVSANDENLDSESAQNYTEIHDELPTDSSTYSSSDFADDISGGSDGVNTEIDLIENGVSVEDSPSQNDQEEVSDFSASDNGIGNLDEESIEKGNAGNDVSGNDSGNQSAGDDTQSGTENNSSGNGSTNEMNAPNQNGSTSDSSQNDNHSPSGNFQETNNGNDPDVMNSNQVPPLGGHGWNSSGSDSGSANANDEVESLNESENNSNGGEDDGDGASTGTGGGINSGNQDFTLETSTEGDQNTIGSESEGNESANVGDPATNEVSDTLDTENEDSTNENDTTSNSVGGSGPNDAGTGITNSDASQGSTPESNFSESVIIDEGSEFNNSSDTVNEEKDSSTAGIENEANISDTGESISDANQGSSSGSNGSQPVNEDSENNSGSDTINSEIGTSMSEDGVTNNNGNGSDADDPDSSGSDSDNSQGSGIESNASDNDTQASNAEELDSTSDNNTNDNDESGSEANDSNSNENESDSNQGTSSESDESDSVNDGGSAFNNDSETADAESKDSTIEHDSPSNIGNGNGANVPGMINSDADQGSISNGNASGSNAEEESFIDDLESFNTGVEVQNSPAENSTSWNSAIENSESDSDSDSAATENDTNEAEVTNFHGQSDTAGENVETSTAIQSENGSAPSQDSNSLGIDTGFTSEDNEIENNDKTEDALNNLANNATNESEITDIPTTSPVHSPTESLHTLSPVLSAAMQTFISTTPTMIASENDNLDTLSIIPTSQHTSHAPTATMTQFPTNYTPNERENIILSKCSGHTSLSRSRAILEVLGQITNPNLIVGQSKASAQYLAFQWITYLDDAILCPPPYETIANDGNSKISELESYILNGSNDFDNNNTNLHDVLTNEDLSLRIIQRYTMAVLYYSFNGHNWNNCQSLRNFYVQDSPSDCVDKNNNDATAVRFLSSDHECTWYGVSCDIITAKSDSNRTDHFVYSSIKGISWPENNLKGPIPVEINTLTSLESLELTENHITGMIPFDAISDLDNIEILKLGNNQMNGNATSFCNGTGENFKEFEADCSSSTSAVVCPCCTTCL